jgi:hypothetical protein
MTTYLILIVYSKFWNTTKTILFKTTKKDLDDTFERAVKICKSKLGIDDDDENFEFTYSSFEKDDILLI